MTSHTPRILFVADAASIHTIKWLQFFEGLEWDVHVFPTGSLPTTPVPATLHVREPLAHDPGSDNCIRPQWPFRRGGYRMEQVLMRLYGEHFNPAAARLAWLIWRRKPDVIHSLRIQDEAYITHRALQLQNHRPAWIVSTWGSDIFHYGRFPEHASQIRAVMKACDVVITDCQRDVRLAVEFGATCDKLPFPESVPGTGGLDLRELGQLRREVRPSARIRFVVPKAFDNQYNRFRSLLPGLHELLSECANVEVEVFRNNDERGQQLEGALPAEARQRLKLYDHIPHPQMLRHLAQARAVVSPSISDGTPNVMLEAMALGALPVMSPLESIHEWVADGRNGLLADAEDPIALANALKRAWQDDDLVDEASRLNWDIISERADRALIRPRVLQLYRDLA